MNTTPWGKLTPGPFAVGFKTTFTTDHSRIWPTADREAAQSRPVFVAIWYPGAMAAVPPLTYGDYLTVTCDDPAYALFAERLSTYVRDVTIRYGLEEKPAGLDPAGLRGLAERQALPLVARRDAPPAAGRFPVILYHPGLGGSYEDNGVLCEYLASHGYLVISSAYQSETGSFHVDWDLDRSLNDFRFPLNAVANDTQADLTRVGAVGQSYGAQAHLAWSSETNSPVRAVVSLDSTIEYAAPNEPGFVELRRRLSRAANVTADWLLFAVAREEPNWAQWEYLANPRWFAETGPMQHADFTAQGLIGTVLRHSNDAEGALLRERYDTVCETTRLFLDACLKNDPNARRLLERQAAPEDQVQPAKLPLTLTHRPARPADAA